MQSHRDLVAVGYQDNSFVVYSILQGFKPLFRGCEHRSFVSQIKFDNYFMKFQMEQRAKEQEMARKETSKNPAAAKLGAEEQKQGVSASSRLQSKNRLVELLRRTTKTRSLTDADEIQDRREYRLISAGEDGFVFFWNVLAPYNSNDLSKVEMQFVQDPMHYFVRVQPSQVQLVRPVHQMNLTVTAQLYAVIIGPMMTTFVDNTGIMTYYKVAHRSTEEDE